LATVARDPEFYVSKAEIIEFHKRHTPRFENCQQAFSWVARLNSWYSSVSAVIHSQIPGNWLTHTSIEGIKPNIATLEVLTAAFVEAERLVHELFLCTVGGDIWGDITAPAKKRLLHALPGNVKQVLKFDGA
jgi:hypothetical protein